MLLVSQGGIRGNKCPRRQNEDKDRAAYLHGNRLDWGLVFYDRVSTPDVLEGCSRDRVVAVLFGSSLQLVGALTSGNITFLER